MATDSTKTGQGTSACLDTLQQKGLESTSLTGQATSPRPRRYTMNGQINMARYLKGYLYAWCYGKTTVHPFGCTASEADGIAKKYGRQVQFFELNGDRFLSKHCLPRSRPITRCDGQQDYRHQDDIYQGIPLGN